MSPDHFTGKIEGHGKSFVMSASIDGDRIGVFLEEGSAATRQLGVQRPSPELIELQPQPGRRIEL